MENIPSRSIQKKTRSQRLASARNAISTRTEFSNNLPLLKD
jgi:hypothetical protein